jgi:Flp pilus assembly protein TadG
MTMDRSAGSRKPSLHGQALVEFALILPVLVLIMLGLFDLGRGVFAFNEVSNAAREGGRTAIVNQNSTDIVNRAVAQATSLGISTTATCTGGIPNGSSGVCTNFFYPDLSTDCSSTVAPGCVAVVTVKYTFNAITPIIGNLIGTIPMTSTTKQEIESACTGSGCPIP